MNRPTLGCPKCGPIAVAAPGGLCPRCGAPVVEQPRAVFGSAGTMAALPSPTLAAAAYDPRTRAAPLAGAVTVPPPPLTQATRSKPLAPPEVEVARADPRRAFGHYIIISELGRGGMGVVYKAWDDALSRPVALKLLASDAEASVKERFRREVQAVAHLRHPSIVAVHDAGEAHGRAFLAMDFIDGTTLAKRVNERTLSLNDGLSVVRTVALAIDYAHSQKIIHRDLKPQNVMLDREDRPYVLDFGLATALSPGGALTRTGSTLGTPGYMPPEQVEGSSESVSPRSDVYSLGATLYHVIAGRPPFEGSTEINVIAQLLTRDPDPPSDFNRRALGDLDTITLKCLEKDPEKRYQTAAALAEELDRWLAGDSIVARPLGPIGRVLRKLRRNAKTTAVSLVAALTAAGALAYARVAPALDARRHARALASASEAAQREAGRFKKEVQARLGLLEKGPLSPGELEHWLAAVRAAVEDVETEKSVIAVLAKALPDSSLDSSEATAICREALPAVGREGLLAQASHLKADVLQARGKATEATLEAARAYRFDPQGPDGAGAFLTLAVQLEKRHEWKRAFAVFETLAARELPTKELAAHANLGAGRTALALGEPDHARARARRAIDTDGLDSSSKAQADLILAITGLLRSKASEPLAIEPGTAVVVPGASGNVLVGFSRVKQGEVLRIVAARLEASGAWVEVASRAVPDTDATKLIAARTPAGPRLFALRRLKGSRELCVYRFDGSSIELDGPKIPFEVPLENDASCYLASVCDLDGDGKLDLVLSASHGVTLPLVVLDVLGTPVAQQPLVSDPRLVTEAQNGVGVDFEGTGKSTLVVAAGKWGGFFVRTVEWSGPLATSEITGTHCIGSPGGMIVVPDEKGREVLYVAGNRDTASEAIFAVPPPDVNPDTNDGIYRMSQRKGELDVVLARPPEQRHTGQFVLRGVGWLGKRWPGSVVAVEETRESGILERRWVFSPGSGEPLYMPWRADDLLDGGVFAADLLGKGELGLVCGSSEGLVVRGLAASGSEPTVREASSGRAARPIDVGLDLLACGEPEEASTQLEAVIKSQATGEAERTRATLALASARSALGRHDQARSILLDLAARDRSFEKEALFRAEDEAESDQDPAGALGLIERIASHEALSVDERRDLDRRRRRVEPLTRLAPAVRVNASTFAGLPWNVRRPLHLAVGARGIVIHGRPVDGDEWAAALPLVYHGGTVRMEAKFTVERLPFGSGFYIALATDESRMNLVYLDCRGGGDVNTWTRGFSTAAGGWRLDEVTPGELMRVELVYLAEDGRVTVRVHAGARTLEGEAWVAPIGRHRPRIEIGYCGWTPPFAHVRAVIHELTIESEPGPDAEHRDLSVAPDEADAAGRALRAFVADRARAEPLLAAVNATSDLWGSTALLDAVALAEGGEVDDAAKKLVALARANENALEPLFEAANALGPRARDALGRAYGKIHGGGQRELGDRAIECLTARNRSGEALAAALAGRVGEIGGQRILAEALAQLGDEERAVELLSQLRDPVFGPLMGMWLCEAGHYEEALAKFGDAPLEDPYFEAYHKRARKYADAKGPR